MLQIERINLLLISEIKFNKIILFSIDEVRTLKSIYSSEKPNALFKVNKSKLFLFDPNIFKLIQHHSSLGFTFGTNHFNCVVEDNLTPESLIIIKIRNGFLLSGKASFQPNIQIQNVLDIHDTLYYLFYGFSSFQTFKSDLLLVKDENNLRDKFKSTYSSIEVQTKILNIFKSQNTFYRISYDGVNYQIQFGPDIIYQIKNRARIEFIISVMRKGKITSDELLKFGAKYFRKKVTADIYVIKRSRRNKEELIKDLTIIEQNKSIPLTQSLSTHLLKSISITEKDYSISYVPESSIEWVFDLPDSFFSY